MLKLRVPDMSAQGFAGEMNSRTSFDFIVNTLDETYEIASIVARSLKGGDSIGLNGPLGAGKTEFVRAMLRGLGVGEDVSSPTFVLESIYDLPGDSPVEPQVRTFHHWDLYRLSRDGVCGDLFDCLGDPTKITAIEWSDRVDTVGSLLSFTIVLGFLSSVSDCGQCSKGSLPWAESTGSRSISIVGIEDRTMIAALSEYRREK